MDKKQWYESLFQNYGETYDAEGFTQGTIGECDFIEKELKYDKSLRILDVGCGTGRHSIELTRRGYKITGVDLSESMLEKAKEKASSQNLEISFLNHDARNLPFDREFDRKTLDCNERYYVPSEITWLPKSLGFDTIEIIGTKLGAFPREDKLTTEDFEMLVIAQRGQ